MIIEKRQSRDVGEQPVSNGLPQRGATRDRSPGYNVSSLHVVVTHALILLDCLKLLMIFASVGCVHHEEMEIKQKSLAGVMCSTRE